MRTDISPPWEKSDHAVKQFFAGIENQAEAEDAALFRALVGKVQPLPDQNRIEPPPRKYMLRAADVPAAIPDTLSDSCDENIPGEFMRNGISRMILRKLRRGTVEDSLDLHGSNIDNARKLLQQFLHEATGHGLRSVLVIHGKGINSQNGEAVLRKLTRHWLMQCPEVLAYCDALPRNGGSGAVLVLLKAQSAQRL